MNLLYRINCFCIIKNLVYLRLSGVVGLRLHTVQESNSPGNGNLLKKASRA